MQDYLRKQVKIAKAEYNDIYFKDFASYINITEHSFYNWLNGYYDLSEGNYKRLKEVVLGLLGLDLMD